MKPRLTLTDYQRAATRLDVDVPTIQAVTEVESGGTGFLPNGDCVIRFEPHIFSKLSRRAFDKTHPHLSYPDWKPTYPVSVKQSWELFRAAAKLNVNAAVMATSWGLFQILGQNATSCDCETLSEFVAKMEESEASQLELFCNLIDNWGMDDELRMKDWAGFARVFNGPRFAMNRYDSRLAAAYAKYSKR